MRIDLLLDHSDSWEPPEFRTVFEEELTAIFTEEIEFKPEYYSDIATQILQARVMPLSQRLELLEILGKLGIYANASYTSLMVELALHHDLLTIERLCKLGVPLCLDTFYVLARWPHHISFMQTILPMLQLKPTHLRQFLHYCILYENWPMLTWFASLPLSINLGSSKTLKRQSILSCSLRYQLLRVNEEIYHTYYPILEKAFNISAIEELLPCLKLCIKKNYYALFAKLSKLIVFDQQAPINYYQKIVWDIYGIIFNTKKHEFLRSIPIDFSQKVWYGIVTRLIHNKWISGFQAYMEMLAPQLPANCLYFIPIWFKILYHPYTAKNATKEMYNILQRVFPTYYVHSGQTSPVALPEPELEN